MLAAASLLAIAATPPSVARPVPIASAQAQILVRIVEAAEVRGGRSAVAHQRRPDRPVDGGRMTLLEFE